jgi:tRNA pseudouridine55 synthase
MNLSRLLLLNKKPGLTSFDALKPVKRALGSGKVGHTGTLDKFAGGLLVILSGRALKLSRYFLHADKCYTGTIFFGDETDTLDDEGAVIASAPPPTRAALEEVLPQFRGGVMQTPPLYSAIHVDGKRAHQIARSGGEAELKARPVTIHSLELVSWEPPFAKIAVHCSSGTYIRSLARDIARAAGSRAHLTALCRTRVGGFHLQDAVRGDTPEEIRAALRQIDKTIFEKINIRSIDVDGSAASAMKFGKPLYTLLTREAPPETIIVDEAPLAVFCRDEFIAIIIRGTNNEWRYVCVN